MEANPPLQLPLSGPHLSPAQLSRRSAATVAVCELRKASARGHKGYLEESMQVAQ
jgi:hypothetical protein